QPGGLAARMARPADHRELWRGQRDELPARRQQGLVGADRQRAAGVALRLRARREAAPARRSQHDAAVEAGRIRARSRRGVGEAVLTSGPAGSIADRLEHDALATAAVELGVVDLLPRPEVELP